MADPEEYADGEDLFEEIASVYRQISEAWRQGDAEGIVYHFADKGDIVDPFGRRASGRVAVADLLKRNFNGMFRGSRMEFRPEGVRPLSDDIAVSIGSWQVTLPSMAVGDGPRPISGPLTTVFRRIGGRWVVDVDRPSLAAPLPVGTP